MKAGYFIPRRLWTDIRLARLSPESWYLAQRMYEAADSWGRFSADPGDLAAWAWLPDHRVRTVLRALADLPLVHLYSVGARDFAQIHRFDDDAKADFLRKRGASEWPTPPRAVWVAAKCSGVCRGTAVCPGMPNDALGQTRADKGAQGQDGAPRFPTLHGTALHSTRVRPADAGARATETAPVSGETPRPPGHQAGGGFPCAYPDGHDGVCVAMSPADKARRDATDCLPSCARWPGHAGRCSDVPLAGSPPASTDTAPAAPVSGETPKPPPWTPDELRQLEYMARRRRQIRVENGLPPEDDRRTHIADATSDLMASVKGEA